MLKHYLYKMNDIARANDIPAKIVNAGMTTTNRIDDADELWITCSRHDEQTCKTLKDATTAEGKGIRVRTIRAWMSQQHVTRIANQIS